MASRTFVCPGGVLPEDHGVGGQRHWELNTVKMVARGYKPAKQTDLSNQEKEE
jgi:hypothetical protein